ncbi:MAG: glycosyltransferase family 39 protein [Verrucomicrobiia bacterium]
MTLLACCLYLLLIALVGYTLLSVIHPSSRLTIVQLIGLGPAVGAGTMGLLLFWTSLIGFAPSRAVLAIIGFLALASLLVMKKTNRLARINIQATDWKKGDVWIVAPLAITLAGLVMIVVVALSSPLSEWDAFAIWGFKAKVLTHDALRPTPAYFHDLTLSYSHLDYPLMFPFLTAGAYAAMGTVDDQTGKLVSVFLDVLIVPMVYLGLRWRLRRLPAACLAAILAMLPVMFRYGGVGCADLPLAMFYAGSILYVARWMDRQQGPDLILAILFSAFAAFTKNEGTVLALMNGAVILGFELWGRRRALIGTAVFFTSLLAMDAAWLIWSRSLPRTHEDYGSKLLSSALVTHLPRLKEIIPAMLVQTAEFQVWGLLWIMAVVLALLGWRALTRPYVLALWILLGLHLMSYALAYSVTPWDLAMLMPITMDRLLLHTVPAVIFLAGWHWAELGTSHRHAGSTGIGVANETPLPAG